MGCVGRLSGRDLPSSRDGGKKVLSEAVTLSDTVSIGVREMRIVADIVDAPWSGSI